MNSFCPLSNAKATHLVYVVKDMVFADYDHMWKLLRKLSNLNILNGEALSDWGHMRDAKLGHMLLAIYNASIHTEVMVISEMLTKAVLSTWRPYANFF